jgi:ABC-type dipeptide/oligopeptide/nickel transport system permease component
MIYKYLLKKILVGLVSLFVFMTLLFFVFQVIMPGDFATQFQGLATNPEDAKRIGEEVRANLGLNLPLWQQYLRWLGNFVRGDLGMSLYGYPVWDILRNFLASTFFVFGLGFLLSLMLGQALAEFSLKIKSKTITGLLSFSAATLYTSFPPWLGFLVILLLAGSAAAIRAQSYRTPLVAFNKLMAASDRIQTDTMMIMLLCLVGFSSFFFFISWLITKKTHIHIIRIVPLLFSLTVSAGVWLLAGLWTNAVSVLQAAIFPFITFVLIFTGETMLVFRTNMLEVKNENFVLFARATGEKQGRVIKRHIIRNSIFPVLSNAIISLPYIMTGLVIIERATGWSGLGSAVFFAFSNQEMPITMGILFIMGVASLALRLILDVVQMLLDPRLQKPSAQSEIEL